MKRSLGQGLQVLVVVTAGALAAATGTAGAATAAPSWTEEAWRAAPGGGVADCLRAPAPGQLTTLGALGRTTIATDLLSWSGGQLTPAGTADLGWLVNCPAVATAPGLPTLLAAPVYEPSRRGWAMRVGQAGGGPAVTLRRQGTENVFPPAIALAPSGAAAVAWYESRLTADRRAWRHELFLATRPSRDAAFGAPRVVATDTAGDPATAPQLGVDAAGVFTLAWHTGSNRGREGQEGRVHVATLAPDGSLQAPQTLTSTSAANPSALAVAPDGGALVATAGEQHVELFERPPGASAFAPVPLPVARATDGAFAVALASGGGAVVADRAEPDTVVALLRPPGGAFGAPQLVTGRIEHEVSGRFGFFLPGERPRRTSPPIDSEHQALAAAIGSDGEVLVTWVAEPDARSADAAHVARGTLTGGFSAPPSRVGSRCRASNAIAPVGRPDGSLGVAWTDNARVRTSSEVDVSTRGGGRVHVAVPGAPASSSPTPALRASAVSTTPALRAGQPLRLRVRCLGGGPCDVRAAADAVHADQPRDPAFPNGRPDPESERDELGGLVGGRAYHASQRVTDATTLAAGATGELTLAPYGGYRLARAGAERAVPVRLTTCVAAGAIASRAVVRPRVRGLPSRPIPWLRDVRATVRDRRVRLTWRTAIPARHGASFLVTPYSARDGLLRRAFHLRAGGRRAFSHAFTVPAGTRASRVELVLLTSEWGETDRVDALPRRR